MTVTTVKENNPNEREYLELRMKILCAAQLDPYVLDDAALELCEDYAAYPFEEAKNPQTGWQQFADSYEGFVAMMKDGFADTPVPEWLDSTLKGFSKHHYYLAWAWYQNDLANYFWSGEALAHSWNEKDVINHGLAAACCAQKAYAHAIEIMYSQSDLADVKLIKH